MKMHKFDGKRYVELGELYHLFKVCMDKARDGKGYGWICGDNEAIRAAHLTTVARMLHEIISDDCDGDTPEQIKQYNRKLKWEFLSDRYVISTRDNNDEELHFQFWCSKASEEENPVFTNDWKYTYYFDDFADAYEMAKEIKESVDGQIKVYVQPALKAFGGDTPESRLFNAIFASHGNVEV